MKKMEKEGKKGTSISAGNCKLTYALNADGDLVHIDTVPNGDACGCFCTKCKEPLIARNGGTKKQHHFAHKPNSNCQGSYETTLHMLAKEIINEEKMMMVPKYYKKREFYKEDDKDSFFDYYFGTMTINLPYISMEQYQVCFNAIEIEKRNDASYIQPDCVGIICKSNKRLAIEINVTHPVDDAKKEKIKKLGLDCIEIKIPKNISMDKEILKEFIIYETNNKTWISNPTGDKFLLEKELLEQKKRIEDYRNRHPHFTAIKKEKCYCCKLWLELFEKQWKKLITNFRKNLLDWVLPITYYSIDEVLRQKIKMYGSKGHKYVIYNNKANYIYPKNFESADLRNKIKSKSTYKFFCELDLIIKNITQKDFYKKCPYFKAKFNYSGTDYVFCHYKYLKGHK